MKLVSLITPAYNSGIFIHRLLDSVLFQTYPLIEMIIIDDGSTDNTAEVIKSYKSKFEAKGYKLNYFYQNNAGQSVAINKALKLFTGDYLAWPDSDDYYSSPQSIETLVEVLDKSDEQIGMVRAFYELIDEQSFNKIGEIKTDLMINTPQNLFESCLFAYRDFWFCSGGYMIKKNAIEKAIKNRDIYTEKDAGQNWQLLLPVLYSYKCITIGTVLYSILVRKSSHSREQYAGYNNSIKKYNSYENTILDTLNRIDSLPLVEKERYKKIIVINYAVVKLYYAYIHFKKKDFYRIAKFLNENKKYLSSEKKREVLFFKITFIIPYIGFAYRVLRRLSTVFFRK